MHPAEFWEHYITASLFLMFVFNSTLALLLGIQYSELRRKGILDLDQPIFGRGEVAQIATSSVIVVIILCLFLCGARVIPCCRFRVSKITASIILAALSMLGACCLTTLGEGDKYCGSNASWNPEKCYRRPDVDLLLTWFSTVIALTCVVASLILHLYDGATRAWPRNGNDGPRLIRRDSLELAKAQRFSNGSDADECQEEAPAYFPPPPYKSSTTPLSSYVLPSIPPRKREMNKLCLTVITDIPPYSSFEFIPLETEPRKG